MVGKFVIYRDKDSRFGFRLKTGKGQVVAQREGYVTRPGARMGAETVQRVAEDAEFEDLYD